ncbi:pyruvate kinase [Thraustotheca clavata]|uniref:Pyruvate kinase n=1 Tax=Thraustotheca clavata TaxID=74557 RepID=A0A1W0A9E6_9STRA|nr:pyruvate kinase [Thraustotheca clavata]
MNSENLTLSPRHRLSLGGGLERRPRSGSHQLHENHTKGDAPVYRVGISLAQILDRNYTHGRFRKTKIICAIGPSCWSVEMLGQLLDAGMNVARFNFSHGDHELHARSLANLRTALIERPGVHCAVLLDTKGPEIRTGMLKDHKAIELDAGQQLILVADDTILGDNTRIGCSYPHLATSVRPGSTILCDDGGLTLRVIECRGNEVVTKVENTYVLDERKNMNLPGAALRIPGITEKDKHDLINFAIPQNVDIVSGSFVRSAANVRAIRECLGEAGRHIRVHAKIESLEALKNIDEIIEEADGVHVSRGDLGMELAPEQVFMAQKLIIRKANLANKPVVTSTQMLQSMTKCPNPSRAECTDVANAVLDGTDCVMLSGETAKGLYPIRSVNTMARICIEAEGMFMLFSTGSNGRIGSINYPKLYTHLRDATPKPISVCEAVASSAVETAIDIQAKIIIALTDSGYTAKCIAKYRPEARVLAITAHLTVARQLAGLSRGLTCMRVATMTGTDDLIDLAIEHAKRSKWIVSGDIVVVLHGLTEGTAGLTNVVKIIEANDHGYSSPMGDGPKPFS